MIEKVRKSAFLSLSELSKKVLEKSQLIRKVLVTVKV